MEEGNVFKPGAVLITQDILGEAGIALRHKAFEINEYLLIRIAEIVTSIVTHERIVIPAYNSPLRYEVTYKEICEMLDIIDSNHRIFPSLLDTVKQTNYSIEEASNMFPYYGWEEYPFVFAYKHGIPIKAFYQPNSIRIDFPRMGAYSTFNDSLLEKIREKAAQKIEDNNEYLKDYFSLDLPIIFNYVLERASSREDILSVAMEVRDTKEARAFRKQLTLLDEAAAVDDRRFVMEIIAELDDKIKSLGKKLDQPTVNLEIALPLSATLSVGGLIKAGLDRIMPWRKRHLIFIEQLYNAGAQSRGIRRHLGKLL